MPGVPPSDRRARPARGDLASGGAPRGRSTSGGAGCWARGVRRAPSGSLDCRGGVMLARQRQERILEQIQLTGGARVSDLVELLGVSDMTIRRDISALARRGLVARVHGGATAVSGRSADEPGFAAKSGLQT